eukprot:GFUD01109835.1.p1 GENE.GFUD01109835.1~~GFUD01109835.1.p1  ORF type:complete len:241 (-),score=46.06 GFUD01109835.1:248-970(-)
MSRYFVLLLCYTIIIDSGKCVNDTEDVFEDENNTISTSIRDLEDYPACVIDEDCLDISDEMGKDYKCFQYMCYPWNDSELEGQFKKCQSKDDCKELSEEEGGDGGDGDCFRHHDIKQVAKGICLRQNEAQSCSEHLDCPHTLQCVNKYCGDGEYFAALGEQQCVDDSVCRDLLLGELCCYDVSGPPHTWPDVEDGQTMSRKCCDNEQGVPVIAPAYNVSGQIDSSLVERVGKLGAFLQEN